MPNRITIPLVALGATLCFLQLASADDYDGLSGKQAEPTVELALSYEKNDAYGVNDSDERIGIEDELLSLELNYDYPFILTDSLSGFFSINATLEREDIGNNQPINGDYVELDELWVSSTSNKKSVWVGRRLIEDASTWWWDDELLGAGITFNTHNYSSQLTAAFSSDPWSTLNASEDPEEESILLLLGSVQARLTSDSRLTTLFTHQSDSSSDYQANQSIVESNFDEQDDQLTWLGIRYERKLPKEALGEMSFLFDVAWMSGKSTAYELEEGDEDESGELESVTVAGKSTTSLSAWALNGWLSWQPPKLGGTDIRMGYAYGTGTNNNRTDGSRTFRQTGLHSNEASTQYYGYIANPSLSNLHITSLLINYPIHEDGNLSAQYNRYRRASTYDDTLEWDVDLEIENNSRDIGYEISAGYELEFDNDVQAEIRAARFYPGGAFGDANTKPLDHYEITISYEF